MKKCPYCAEAIQDDAIKCRHCGSMLGDLPAAMPTPARVLSATDAEIRDLLFAKNKIAAIKLIRDRQALGLQEAKAHVERLALEIGIPEEPAKRSAGFGCAVIFLLCGGVAFLSWVSRMGTSPGLSVGSQGPSSSEILARSQSAVESAEKAGMIQRYTCVGNEALVNPNFWRALDADGKKGLTVSLALICKAQDSGDYMTIIDARSAQKLAEVRGGVFKVY